MFWCVNQNNGFLCLQEPVLPKLHSKPRTRKMGFKRMNGQRSFVFSGPWKVFVAANCKDFFRFADLATAVNLCVQSSHRSWRHTENQVRCAVSLSQPEIWRIKNQVTFSQSNNLHLDWRCEKKAFYFVAYQCSRCWDGLQYCSPW